MRFFFFKNFFLGLHEIKVNFIDITLQIMLAIFLIVAHNCPNGFNLTSLAPKVNKLGLNVQYINTIISSFDCNPNR